MNSRDFMYNDPAVLNALKGIERAEAYRSSVEMPVLPDPMVLAMSYVPMQIYKDMYPVDEGFQRGTAFPELDKPFLGGKCN